MGMGVYGYTLAYDDIFYCLRVLRMQLKSSLDIDRSYILKSPTPSFPPFSFLHFR